MGGVCGEGGDERVGWGESIEGGGWGRARRKKQMCEQEEGSQAAAEGEERRMGKGLGGAVTVRADRSGQARPRGRRGCMCSTAWGGVGEQEREG